MRKFKSLGNIFTVLIATVILLSGCSDEKPKIEQVKLVKAVKINTFDVFEQRQFTGQVKGVDEINLMFRVGGPLVKYPVNVGDKVVAGEVIAQVDPHDFKVKVSQLEGQLATARATKRLADKDNLRAKTIHQKDSRLISDAELDRRKAAFDTATGQVSSLKASLQTALDDLSYTELKAPFNGRVVATYVDNFEYVRPQQAVVKIVSLDALEVIIDVPESLISAVNNVQDIKVTFPNLADLEVAGRITEVGSEASFRTRTYPVTVKIAKPAGVEILAGMTVAVSGRVANRDFDSGQTFVLPLASVFRQGEQSYVWRVTDDLALEKVAIDSEKLVKSGVSVMGELNHGDTVVIAGTKFLEQGDTVEILPIDKLMR